MTSLASGMLTDDPEGHTVCDSPLPVNAEKPRLVRQGCRTGQSRSAEAREHESEQTLGIPQGTLYVSTSMQLTFFSYRFASEVLDSPEFIDKKNDIVQVFTDLEVPQRPKPKQRPRAPGMTFTTNQKALNVALNNRFKAREWQCQPPVTNDRVTKIKADWAEESGTRSAR